jgi:hypothetical protein
LTRFGIAEGGGYARSWDGKRMEGMAMLSGVTGNPATDRNPMRSAELIGSDEFSRQQPPPNLSGILTLSEAALQLRCSKAHLCNILSGKVSGLPVLPVMRIGRRVLIRSAALLDWMKTLETGAIMRLDLNSSLATHRKA